MTNQSEDLLNETQRVLEDQIQIIQEQQAQATRIIRVGLTFAGLILTLLSIAASSGIISVPSIGSIASFNDSYIILLIGFPISILILLVVLRIFAPALAVLSPQAAESQLFQLFTATPLIDRRETAVSGVLGDEYSEIFGESISLRSGLDASEIAEYNDSGYNIKDIIEYDAGCVEGNEAIIETNRRHLSQIYRSAALISFFLSSMVIYSIFIPVLLDIL